MRRVVRMLSVALLLVFVSVFVAAAPSSHRLRSTPTIFTPHRGVHQKKSLSGSSSSRHHHLLRRRGELTLGSWKSGKREIPMSGGTLNPGAFFMDLTVGSGAGQQVFSVLVDTGSSNTAVPSVGCASCGQTSGFYNASASPTAHPLPCESEICRRCTPSDIHHFISSGEAQVDPPNDQNCPYGPARCVDGNLCGFSISYGGASSFLSGHVVADVACVGGGDAGASCAPIFLDAITSQFPQGNLPNGIIGLAYPANGCNPTCQPTFLDSLVANGTLAPDEDKFGMCLSKQSGGVLDLGFFNSSRARGGEAAFQWTPIVKEHWYNIRVLAMAVGDHDSGAPAEAFGISNDAIGSFVDSGTGVLLMSPSAYSCFTATIVNKYGSVLRGLDALLGGEQVALTDDELAAYPLISFTVSNMDGSGNFTVSVSAANYLLATPPATGNSTALYSLGVASVSGLGLVMGDVIMQEYYIAFDRAGKRLGFAPLQDCHQY